LVTEHTVFQVIEQKAAPVQISLPFAKSGPSDEDLANPDWGRF